jgi:tetratricopeptide (TPR) repeat protein
MKNNPSSVQKIALITFGIVFSLVLLELGLRFGGFVLLLNREYRNSVSARQAGVYKIMCLGESTTQGQYPAFLEKALNRKKCRVPFSVIDKGVVGTTSRTIIAQLESNLAAIKPDLVVVMMGINDGAYHMVYKEAPDSKLPSFLTSLKIYNFARWLAMHVFVKVGKRGLGAFEKINRQNDGAAQLPDIKADIFNERKPQEKVDETGCAIRDIDRAYIELGWVYRDQGKISLSQAERSYVRATKLNPSDDQAYIGLAQVYREQGRLREAEQCFQKARKLNPKNNVKGWSLIERAWVYRDAGRFSESEELLKQAIEFAPDNEWAYINLGWVYRDEGQYSEAEEAFKKAIEINPKNNWAYIKLGQVYRDEGKLSSSEAAAAFKKSIELNPGNDWAYINLGWVYRDEGKYNEAEAAFEKAIALNPGNNEPYLGLGWVYSIQSKLLLAETAFKKASSFGPPNEDAFIGLGQVYRDQGKMALAEEAFKKAIEINPNNDEAYINLGWFYRNNGRLDQAEKFLKIANTLNPNYDRIYGLLAALYKQMGKPDLEKKYTTRAQEMRSIFYNPVTISSYRQLKEILDARGILLVCVQYPMHSVAPLKKIFEGQSDVFFVDNEKVFKDAVKKDGYKEYFNDMFGGDFGHCTDEGNKFLAGNIANVILSQAFHC